MWINQRRKKWLIRSAVAAMSAGVVLLPATEPVVVTARQIDVRPESNIFALAYIDSGVPYLPAALLGSGWTEGAERLVAGGLNFSDALMDDARNQAWVAATYIDSGTIPETWVQINPVDGSVSNVIACAKLDREDFPGCVSEKPVQPAGGLVALIRALKAKGAAAEIGETTETVEAPEPVVIDGKFGYPIEPAQPGAWFPVLDKSVPPLPAGGDLGLWMGGSVGLAYTLAFLDHLGGPIAPPGVRIGATGTIYTSPTGSSKVGKVMGVKEKAEGAQRAGVNILFVPQGQSVDAGDPKGITVVEVTSAFEALKWLCEHGSEARYCQNLFSKAR